MNGEEEMSINEKENTESVDKEMDNGVRDIRRDPTFQQYEKGVHLALTLAEFDIAHISLKPAIEVDIYKRILDAIAKARNKPIPTNKITALLNSQRFNFQPYSSIAICSGLSLIAQHLVKDVLAEESSNRVDPAQCSTISRWLQYCSANDSLITACLNSMIFGYNYVRCAANYSVLTELVRALCPNPKGADMLIRMAEGQYNPQQIYSPYAQFAQGTPLWTYPSPLQTTTTDKQ